MITCNSCCIKSRSPNTIVAMEEVQENSKKIEQTSSRIAIMLIPFHDLDQCFSLTISVSSIQNLPRKRSSLESSFHHLQEDQKIVIINLCTPETGVNKKKLPSSFSLLRHSPYKTVKNSHQQSSITTSILCLRGLPPSCHPTSPTRAVTRKCWSCPRQRFQQGAFTRANRATDQPGSWRVPNFWGWYFLSKKHH